MKADDVRGNRAPSGLRAFLLLVVVVTSILAQPITADIVLPARLAMSEKEPGAYEVTFTLPIVGGRKLRAAPVLPPGCSDLTPRETSVSALGHTTTWTTKCEGPSLAGELIWVDGLLGGQTELAFSLDTLDGRSFSEILRPSRPGFLVPEPPTLGWLASQGVVDGVRRALRDLPLWLLFLIAPLSGIRGRGQATAVASFALAHGLAQWLGGAAWLVVPAGVAALLTLLPVILPSAALAGAKVRLTGWRPPFWLLTALLGALLGGTQSALSAPDGLTTTEHAIGIAFESVGVAFGLLLISLIGVELDVLTRMVRANRRRQFLRRSIGYLIGIITVAAFTSTTVSLTLLPDGSTPGSIELYAFALLSGLTLAATGRPRFRHFAAFAILLALGGSAGLLRLALPLGSTIVLGSLLLLGVTLLIARPLSERGLAMAVLVSLPAHAWAAAAEILETASRSTGVAAGVGLVALFAFGGGIAIGHRTEEGRLPRYVRLVGGGVALFALATRLSEYESWIDRDVATEAALGLLRLPVLAMILLVIGLAVWPRRRRVVDELGIETRRRPTHWVLLTMAFLLLPYGTVTARNPFFEPHAPRDESARRVATRVLSDTYEAFNIEDEDELYDRLSASVTADLVDDLYLDSRRRLTAGTRTGTEVTVRDVSVLEIGEPRETATREAVYEYPCSWVVVARVQHLQHVHHRRNLYNGILTLKADGGHWKIAGLELLSEDRSVLPVNPS